MPVQLLLVFCSILLLGGCADPAPQPPPPEPIYSFLTWERSQDQPPDDYGRRRFALCQYSPSDSGYVRQEIFSDQPNIPHHSHFHSNVYRNRYLISEWGHVFDLDHYQHLQLPLARDLFIDQRSDSLIYWHLPRSEYQFHEEDSLLHSSIEDGFYCHNLKTGAFIHLPTPGNFLPVESDKSPLPSVSEKHQWVFSPNGSKVLWFDGKQEPTAQEGLTDEQMICAWSRIWPTAGNWMVQDLATGDTLFQHPAVLNFGLRLPFRLSAHWLNEHEIMAQEENGKVIHINLKSGVVTPFNELTIEAWCGPSARFETDASGQLWYGCQNAEPFDWFRVDLEHHQLVGDSAFSLGPNVDQVRTAMHPNVDHLVSYAWNDSLLWADDSTLTRNYRTCDQWLAVATRALNTVHGFETYPGAVYVMNQKTGTTDHIPIPGFITLIGWVKETPEP